MERKGSSRRFESKQKEKESGHKIFETIHSAIPFQRKYEQCRRVIFFPRVYFFLKEQKDFQKKNCILFKLENKELSFFSFPF